MIFVFPQTLTFSEGAGGARLGQNMSTNDKLESIENWRSGTIKIMVCTNAFGMGIDQPDVDIFIRIGCPPTIESMVQEFGRGGRDGRPAQGML